MGNPLPVTRNTIVRANAAEPVRWLATMPPPAPEHGLDGADETASGLLAMATELELQAGRMLARARELKRVAASRIDRSRE